MVVACVYFVHHSCLIFHTYHSALSSPLLLPPLQSAPSSPSKNYIEANVLALPIVAAANRRSPTLDAAAPLPKRVGYGAVPEYLSDRKAVWAVEEAAKRKAAEEKKACPPGHRMMPEEERAATLMLVTQSLSEAKGEVSSSIRVS